MNIYRQPFRAKCPANGRTVDYTLTITVESECMILVEDIQKAVHDIEGYQEQIANRLYALFGGSLHLIGHHHGTTAETTRP